MERGKMAEAESLETAAEHERILREIESTDTACIGPTLRYPRYRGHRWAGTGGTGGQALSGLYAGTTDRWADARPSLRRGRRSTSTLGEALPLRNPYVGSLPDRRRPQPDYSVGSLCFPPGWGSLRFPSEASPARAARSRPTDGGS